MCERTIPICAGDEAIARAKRDKTPFYVLGSAVLSVRRGLIAETRSASDARFVADALNGRMARRAEERAA